MSLSAKQLEAVAATEIERLHRLAHLGDSPTAGPEAPHDEPPPVVPSSTPAPRWVDGWWAGARRMPAHPGRIGGVIAPFIGIKAIDMLLVALHLA